MLPEIGTDETLDEYRVRLVAYVHTTAKDPKARMPSSGGCWYCYSDQDLDAFSLEFDTYIHRICVERWMKANPRDDEVRIISTELHVGLVG